MIELNYKTFGQGQPIVFLHGLFGMLDNWQTFAKKMSESGFMVYLIDQRDHGKSPRTSEFNYPVLAEDLRDFLQSQWIYNAIIVGHSMGGKTAMQFASLFPEMVEKLVVVDIAPKNYKGGHQQILDALGSIDLVSVNRRSDVEKHLRHHLPNEEESTIQFLMKNLQRNKTGGFQWKMNVELLTNEYQNILNNIEDYTSTDVDIPTLFVRGEHSNYIQDDDWVNIQQSFNNAELVTIREAGHWIHATHPDELFEVIISFIDK